MRADVRLMRVDLGIDGFLLLYVGNLEAYQGIDLLLQSFALALKKRHDMDLVIVGGDPYDIAMYMAKAKRLGIGNKVHFLGPRPLELLPDLLSEADVLVSTRTRGTNTPMKIYPYLQSGKPVLATNLLTHTQVLNSEVAVLAEPEPEPFSEAMLFLIDNENVRKSLGTAGKRLVEEQFSYGAFRAKLESFLEWLEEEIRTRHTGVASPERKVP